ncbi:MAG: hypothetical protein ACR2QF_03270 [Geminicoccaceae bacterium]
MLSASQRIIRVFDTATGEAVGPIGELWSYPFGFGPVVFSQAGERFLVLTSGQAASQNRFDVYETATGALLHKQVADDGNISPSSAVFGPGDGTVIATTENEVIVYDLLGFHRRSHH